MLLSTTLTICILGLLHQVLSAGIAVHLTIAARLSEYLPHDIQDRYNYYLAGAFYPDALYNCMGKSDFAEAAHWPPFMQKAAQAYLKKQRDPNLKAFLYGVYSHQIADVSWHSLRGKQGLLSMVDATEFSETDTNSEAHTFLDTAGDFITLSKQLGNLDSKTADAVQSFFATRWRYPAEDLIRIYQDLGMYGLAGSDLEICILRGYAALQGEVAGTRTSLASRRLGYYVDKSPLVDDLLDDYFYGGLDEIVTSARVCMAELDRWFQGDISRNPWHLCSIFEFSSKNEEPPVPRQKPAAVALKQIETKTEAGDGPLFLYNGVPNSLFGYSLEAGHFLGSSQDTLAVGAPVEDIDGSTYLIPLEGLDGRDESMPSVRTFDASYDFHDLHFPPRFGNSMVSWRLPSGLELLAVAEPGSSTIQLFYEGRVAIRITHYGSIFRLGQQGTKQLGLGLAKIGATDLLVTSMFSDGANKRPQEGFAEILGGAVLENRILQGISPSSVLDIEFSELVVTKLRLPVSLYLGKEGYEQMGVSAAETDKFILVGLNSIASVLVYDKSSGIYLAKTSLSTDPGRLASNRGVLFGFNFIVTGKFRGREWVLVSASAETEEYATMGGAVYLYVVQGTSLHKVVKIVPGNAVSDLYARFGTAAAVLNSTASKVLISGEGYQGGRGAIWQISVPSILQAYAKCQGDCVFVADTVVFEGPSGAGYTAFGKSLKVFSHNSRKYLAVGMPKYGYNVNAHEQNMGCVGIYRISTD